MNTLWKKFSTLCDFQGCIGRAPYIYCVLAYLVIIFLNLFISLGMESLERRGQEPGVMLLTFVPLLLLAGLSMAIMFWSLTVKRLHDVDKSGWWALLILIWPLTIGVLVYLCAAKGKEGMEQKWRAVQQSHEKRVKIRK